MDSPDLEQFQDRVITDARLIELMLEKEAQMLALEKELSAVKYKLNTISQLWRAVQIVVKTDG